MILFGVRASSKIKALKVLNSNAYGKYNFCNAKKNTVIIDSLAVYISLRTLIV